MSGDIEIGNCSMCGKKGPVKRTYYRYDIKCSCHSPNHFEIVWACSGCIPKEPSSTNIVMNTKNLKKL